ncbi:HNH endonuclease [Rhizobium rhizogenes]
MVDHIIAIAKGGDPFPPLSGLMSMCAPCHNIKTNAVDHPNASGFRRALKGYDVHGNPISDDAWERADGVLRREADAPAFEGRRSTAGEPAVGNDKDLVLCESFATSNKEANRWV